MEATIVGLKGALSGKRFSIGNQPLTFGRSPDNAVVIDSMEASRFHAELRLEAGGYVLRDLRSSNGTWVNGRPVTTYQLQPGDEIVIGEEAFGFEMPAPQTIRQAIRVVPGAPAGPQAASHVLRVTVTGGGPVGLSLALLLDDLMGPRVTVRVYDSRWVRDNGRVVWKTAVQGNVRRQQMVTIQSRQYLKLPPEVQERLFAPGAYTEMWPKGTDSIEDLGPRNVRIAYIEDQLLTIANEKPDHIELIPERFDPANGNIAGKHVLAICEGSRSRTLEHFAARFGACDSTMCALDGRPVQDVVLGLRVKSELPDPMAVLLTVAQNRFLLNSPALVTEWAPACHLSQRGVAWEAVAPAPDLGGPGQAGRFGRIESVTVGLTDWPGEFYRLDFGVIDYEPAEFVHVDGSQPIDPRAGTQMPSPGRGRR